MFLHKEIWLKNDTIYIMMDVCKTDIAVAPFALELCPTCTKKLIS